MAVQRQAIIRWISLVLSLFWLGFALAQEKPAAGVKLDLEQLELLLRGRLPGQENPVVEEIFNNTRGQIVRGVRDAVADFDKAMNFKDSKRVNVTREFLRKPVLQTDWLSKVGSHEAEWLRVVEAFYRDPSLNFSEEFIQKELSEWRQLFENLKISNSFEEAQKTADEFFKVNLGDEEKVFKRSDLPVERLPLFLRQKEDWLRALRSAYSNGQKSEDLAWVDESIQHWSLIFEEMMDWELSVTYDIDFHPGVESVDILHEFLSQGNLASVDARLQLDPLLHIRSISIFLQNLTTGELISLGLPEDYEQKWKLSDKLIGGTELGFQLNLKSETPVQVGVGPAKTNVIPSADTKGIWIRESDVDAFMADILTPARAQLVLAQLRPAERSQNTDFEDLQSFEKIQRQLESDVKNFLGQKELEVAALVLQTANGKIETQVMILSGEGEAELRSLYEMSRELGAAKIVADFRTKIPLDVDQALLDIDIENQIVVGNFNLPAAQNLKWKNHHFELPSAFFKDVENPLAQSLVQKFQEIDLKTEDLEIETNIEFPELSRGQSELQIRLPLIWSEVESQRPLVPQIDLHHIGVEAPGVENGRISDVRFRSNQNQNWVQLDFKSSQPLPDQIYDQLHHFVENIKTVVGEEGFQALQKEVAAYIKQLALDAQVSLAPGPGQAPGASGIISGLLEIQAFDLAADAIEIDWSISEQVMNLIQMVHQRKVELGEAEFRSGFESLPQIYKIFENQKALHRIRTSVQLPKTIRIQVENFENAEAKIKYLEFSLASAEAPQLTVYWKFVRDGDGRLLMLPELHNLASVLNHYEPVTQSKGPVKAAIVEGVTPKGLWAKAADTGSSVLSSVGGTLSSAPSQGVFSWIGKLGWTAAGRASGALNSEIQDIKIETVHKKIEEEVMPGVLKLVDPLVLKLTEKSNGYLLQDLEVEQVSLRSRDIERVRGNERRPARINEKAPLRALQNQFEKILKTQVAELRLQERLGRIFVENENLVGKSVNKIRNLIVNTVEGKGPFPAWPKRFTNAGLAQTWKELEEKASQNVAELPQTSIKGILGNPNAKNGEVSGINQRLQTEVKTKVEEAMNKPFQNIRLPLEETQKPDSKFDLILPNVVCFDSPEDPLASISVWYEEQNSSFIPAAPRPALDRLAQKYMDGKKALGEPVDALVWLSLDEIQQKIIEPNLENARKLLNEEILKNMPGTEVLLGNVELKVEKNSQGHEQVFAYTELRLKQKAGFIKFDSGADFLSVRIPLNVNAANANSRPEGPDSEVPVGYNIQIYPDYPIEILDPNSGNIVDHWLKKYIAYPKLAEAIVYQEYQGNNPRIAKQQRRVQEIPIPVDIGVPKADQLARFNIDALQFVKDENGEAYVFVPANYRLEAYQNSTRGDGLRIQMNSSSFQWRMERIFMTQLDNPDFVFRRMFENVLEDSDTKDWAFSRNHPIRVEFIPSSLSSMIEESADHPGQFIFRARIAFIQESGEERISILERTEIEIAFEHMQVMEGDKVFYLVDPEPVRFRTLGNKKHLNEASQEFIEYLEEVEPRPLRLELFPR